MKYLISLSLLLFVASCQSMNELNTLNHKNPNMSFENNQGKDFENYIESIREGSQSTGGGKSSAGCGCK